MNEKVKEIEKNYKRPKLNYYSLQVMDDVKYLLSRIMELENNLSEMNNAIEGAQMDNSHEVHCTCVPLLKMKIKDLEGIEDERLGGYSLVAYVNRLSKLLIEARVRIVELEEEKRGMVRLSREDMKKLGWTCKY